MMVNDNRFFLFRVNYPIGRTNKLPIKFVLLNYFFLQIKKNKVDLPKMEATLKNIIERLKPFEYLNTNGLYRALHLRQLSQELEEIHQTTNEAHKKNPNKETLKLLNEVDLLQC